MKLLIMVVVIIARTVGCLADCCLNQDSVTSVHRLCPKGWVQQEDDCYKLFTELKPFEEAETICQSLGGHLASLSSKRQHSFLIDYILREVNEDQLRYVLIGGKRKKPRFIWLDLTSFDYTDWIANAPHTDPGADCVHLTTDTTHYNFDTYNFGKMIDHSCLINALFMCQVKMVSGKGSHFEQDCD